MVSIPGLAGLIVLVESLAAKVYMTATVRFKQTQGDYESVNLEEAQNASKAQLNVAEYEALFIAIFLFLHVEKVENILVTIVAIVVPLAQAVYFWGRVVTKQASPWAPLGALPRYLCMLITLYILWVAVDSVGNVPDRGYIAGLAAVAVLFLSLGAKLYMSFAFRAKGEAVDEEKMAIASAAQLNLKEYEAVFVSIFLFLFVEGTQDIIVTIVSVLAPLAQAGYFATKIVPLPGVLILVAALTRYLCMAISVYFVISTVCVKAGDADVPGFAAAAMIFLCLAAKLFMSFRVRMNNLEGPYAESVSKAQLNAAEYDELFVAIFLFLSVMRVEGIFVTILCIVAVLSQAVYFWGRAVTGETLPWGPAGAGPRYLCLIGCVVVLGMNVF